MEGMNQSQAEELISRKELAKRLSVSPDFLKRSNLPIVRLGNRCVRYRVSDVLNFIEQHRIKAA